MQQFLVSVYSVVHPKVIVPIENTIHQLHYTPVAPAHRCVLTEPPTRAVRGRRMTGTQLPMSCRPICAADHNVHPQSGLDLVHGQSSVAFLALLGPHCGQTTPRHIYRVKNALLSFRTLWSPTRSSGSTKQCHKVASTYFSFACDCLCVLTKPLRYI
jgi:hypothetical protein